MVPRPVDESPLTEGSIDPADLPGVITDALRRHSQATDGELLTGWLAISEWMAPDGERYLRFTVDEGMMFWHVFGFLRAAQRYFDQQYDEG